LNNNRFERCGRGVYVTSTGSNEILDNVVLRSVGDGLAARGTIIGNTIALSGGNGIASAPTIGERFDLPAHSDIARNVSGFNAGFGLLAGNSVHLACNDWFGNGGGATQGTVPAADDIQLDPLFCDLASGDVRVDASSPLVAAECGPIGADTVGCGTQVIAASVAPLGSSQLSVRGRGAVAQFSLVDSSPATLEVLDVQGRLVARENLAAPTAGPHDLAFGARLPAGMYFLRLRQAGRQASGKSIVVHY
jgi:hypothetical protein